MIFLSFSFIYFFNEFPKSSHETDTALKKQISKWRTFHLLSLLFFHGPCLKSGNGLGLGWAAYLASREAPDNS